MEKTRRFAFFVCLVAIFVLTAYQITTYILTNETEQHQPAKTLSSPPLSGGGGAPTSDSVVVVDYNVVYVTFPNSQTAEHMAEHLVNTNVASYVKIIKDVTSFYSWNDKIERDSEVLLVIKSRKSLLPELTQMANKQHPYEVPEIIAFDVTTGDCKTQSDNISGVQ
eukprot:GHVS01003382.1.p1 GENE.GHVS01003382.1~~GHVS01003382.1.p1  ORF type:complete len:166 (+),score=29.01 GHVS01003382.1:58-555(+)